LINRYIFVFLHWVLVFTTDRISFCRVEEIVVFAWPWIIPVDVFIGEPCLGLSTETEAASLDFVMTERAGIQLIMTRIWHRLPVDKVRPVSKSKICCPGLVNVRLNVIEGPCASVINHYQYSDLLVFSNRSLLGMEYRFLDTEVFMGDLNTRS
jgi:hypothetical protein